MTSLRMLVGDVVTYEGPPIALPGVGGGIHNDGHVVPVEAITRDFRSDNEVTRHARRRQPALHLLMSSEDLTAFALNRSLKSSAERSSIDKLLGEVTRRPH